MDEQIRITVSPEGKATVEVIGGRGEGCLQATREIERALGDVDDRKKKPEFYQVTPTNQQKLGHG